MSSSSGWWEYDPRANADLESAYIRGDLKVELLLAGYVYVVDLRCFLQYRKSDPSRRRTVKRDVRGAASKGVAGIRSFVHKPQHSHSRSNSSNDELMLNEALRLMSLTNDWESDDGDDIDNDDDDDDDESYD